MINNIDSFNNPTWQANAACSKYDPRIFFEKGGDNVKRARTICGSCPVKKQCLDWTLLVEKDFSAARLGIYAGLLPSQRAKIKLCVLPLCVQRKQLTYGDYCSQEHIDEHEQLRKDNRYPSPPDFYMKGSVGAYAKTRPT